MTQIIALLKTLLMKDADPAELNKPWWMRRRTMQKIVAVIGALLYFKWGLVLDSDVQDTISDNYEVIVNSLSAAFAAALTLWGVVGAIVGQKGATKKLKAALKECQQPPQPTKYLADTADQLNVTATLPVPDKVEPIDLNPPESPRSSQ